MQLTKLEINGFKSFAKRTELIFEPGITGILGPNGCGKSNIADAFRFVLGEQSARALRGKKVEDFIFGGTEKRKAMSYCQVSMYFDNSDGTLASPFSEVVVSRHAYRSGESEYFINKTPCRLKDIHELFRDTGIGKDGYSIIGQGRVGEILSDRSGDRRDVFEEAAGVMKYRARKEEAERKLDNTKKNLIRLDDIISELESRLEPLRLDSEKATEYFKYREELRDLEINLLLYQYDRAAEKAAQLTESADALAFAIDNTVIEESLIAAACNDEEERERGLSVTISEVSQKLVSMSSDVESAAGRENLLLEKKRALEAEIQRLNAQSEEYRAKINVAEEMLRCCKDACEKENRNYELLNKEFSAAEAKLREIEDKITEKEALLENRKQAMMDAMNRIADTKSRISRFDAMRSSLSDRISAIISERSEYESEGQKLSTELNEANAALDSVASEKVLCNDALTKATNRVNAVNEQIFSLSRKQRESEDSVNSMRSRIKVLTEMKRAHEGYYSSVRRLLNDAERNTRLKSCIHGVVAELISVPPEYVDAVEMALGTALQNIVVPNEQDAKFIIEYLRKNDYGRATLLPVNAMKPRLLTSEERSFINMDGCYGVASDLISYSPAYRSVIENLLGRVVIVRDIDVGIAINKRAHSSFRIATLKGDILNPGGSMTGGSIQKREFSLLGREREIEELNRTIKQTESSITDISAKIFGLNDELEKANTDVSQAVDSLRALEVQVASFKEKADIVNKYVQKNIDLIAKLDDEAEKIRDSLADIEAEREKALADATGLSDGNAVTNDDIRSVQQEISLLRGELQKANNALTDVRVRLTASEKELSASEADAKRLEKEISELNSSVQSCERACSSAFSAISEIEAERNSLVYELNSDRDKFEKLNEELKHLESERAERLKALDEKRASREHITQQLVEMRDRKHRFELNLNRAQIDMQAATDRLWSEYELTYENALPFRHDIQITPSHIRADELKKSIKALGTVNTAAIEDYRDVSTRYNELSAQCSDLKQAEADLNELISKLTATMEKEFKEQFALIQKNFSSTFLELFGGGRAELVLSDTNDVLNCNIDIIAQPPGKKLQLLSLLSGGEQALTAIALLFAILKLKPAAFCILDEIDTSLDEANVDNFAEYLKKYSTGTQFIIITHRKGAMAVCNTLYGVSMEERGVSSLVSAKFTK
ncbi:MAG: chromosome segregation protein SMC [Christensenellales bacterium]